VTHGLIGAIALVLPWPLPAVVVPRVGFEGIVFKMESDEREANQWNDAILPLLGKAAIAGVAIACFLALVIL